MKRKLVALTLVAAMAGSLAACGGGEGGGTQSGGSSNGGGVSITIFNSKMEVQDQFVEMAERYSEATGVDVEVYYSNDTVASHIATKYAGNDPYTLAMMDAKDIYGLAGEYGADMTGEKWTENTEYAIEVDGKVVGFPVCVEARA